MWDSLIRSVLKICRKHYLIPFLDGVLYLGRPSTFMFPPELAEQALSLLLTGLNNTLAIQSNLDWIWPYWYEQQRNPDGRAFIPTGVNILTANLSFRNWTSVGIPGSSRESMVDPVGMLTLHPFGWSVFPYLRIGNENYFPPLMGGHVTQKLRDEVYPEVLTVYHLPLPLSWSSEIYASKIDSMEGICFNHILINNCREPLHIIFGIALRPYNVLSIGHINKLKFKEDLWRINQQPALWLGRSPDKVILSGKRHADPLISPETDVRPRRAYSKNGILSGVSEYSLALQPGEIFSLETFGPLKFQEKINRVRKRIRIKANDITHSHENFCAAWKKHHHDGLCLRLPDKHLENAFYAIKNHLHVFDDGHHFSPGTFFYHFNWFRDSAFISLAFLNLGFQDAVKNKIPDNLSKQSLNGYFKSQSGEWDSTGQALVTLVQYIKRSGDSETLERIFPRLCRGVHWIKKMTGKTQSDTGLHQGLLPAGISSEHFGPADHYFWDNFWCLAGMEQVHWCAKKLDKRDIASRIEENSNTYRTTIERAIENGCKHTPQGGLPSSPYRRMDSAVIGNLVAPHPLDLWPTSVPWLRPTVNFLMDHNLLHNMFFQKIIHTGLNPYLTVQLAKTLMILEDPRFYSLLEALLGCASATWSWPEAINPVTLGGCMGDGDHGWAASEVLTLIRDMLIHERAGALHLGMGIPGQWWRKDLDLEVKQSLTDYGILDYRLTENEGQFTLRWKLRRHDLQDEAPLYFYIPSKSSKLGVSILNKIQLDRSEGLKVFSVPSVPSVPSQIILSNNAHSNTSNTIQGRENVVS